MDFGIPLIFEIWNLGFIDGSFYHHCQLEYKESSPSMFGVSLSNNEKD
jgi:hypothetical protein